MNLKNNTWIFWISILLVFLICSPYLYGFANQTDVKTFSGSFIGVDDQNSYLAKMRYGYEGYWLYKSPYTDYPQNGMIAFLPYILLGKLGGGENLVGQFQFFLFILRIAAAILFLFSLNIFFETFLGNEGEKKIAILLTIFGGGFGFLYFTGLSGLWGGRLPLEFYSPETFSFLALLTLPHIIIARALMLLAIVSWFTKKNFKFGKIQFGYEIITAILGYLIYLFQPITLPILLGIIFIHILISILAELKIGWSLFTSKTIKSAFLFFFIVLPGIGYNLYLLLFDKFVQAWGTQNILTTSPITDYLLAYGLYIVFGIIYIIRNYKESEIPEKTLAIWICISLIGIYLPISIQRRFVEGSWVFIVLLFIKAIRYYLPDKMSGLKMRIAISILYLSSFFLFLGSLIQLSSMADRVYVPNDKINLYRFIDQHIESEYIFASHDVGNELPVWTSNYTITGVGPESINEKIYLKWYEDLEKGTLTLQEFQENLIDKKIIYYVLPNELSTTCESVYIGERYTLCGVGQYE